MTLPKSKVDMAEMNEELVRRSYDDWRLCFPKSIAEDGIIPRTPTILMESDPSWF